MNTYKIALLPGDGIGEEVCAQAVKILQKIEEKQNHTFKITHGLIGGAAWEKHQNHFPETTKTLVKESDAVLFGSVGGPVNQQFEPQWKDCEKNSILSIRKFLNLSINLRPAPIFSELSDFCPLKKEIIGCKSFEILVIRELSGGIYFGEHTRPTKDTAKDVAEYDRATIQKLAHFAFKTAQERKKILHSIDKANVLETSRLWREVFEEESKDWPTVKLEHIYVDNAVQQLVKNPRQFDVLACPNLFGDIISDLTSVFPGSLGMLGSASFGTGISEPGFQSSSPIHLYEPSGGSAPDIAGENIANPIAQIMSSAMMLRFSFGLHTEADQIDAAIKKTIHAGYRTGDIFSKKPEETRLNCSEMGDRIVSYL